MAKPKKRTASQGISMGLWAGILFSTGLVSAVGSIAIMKYTPAYGRTIENLIFFLFTLSAIAVALRSLQMTRDTLALTANVSNLPYLKYYVQYTDTKASIRITNVGDGTAFLQDIFTRSDIDRGAKDNLWITVDGMTDTDIQDFPIAAGETCRITIPTTYQEGEPFDGVSRTLKNGNETLSYISSFTLLYRDIHRQLYTQTVIYSIRPGEEGFRVTVLGIPRIEGTVKRIHEHVFAHPQLRGVDTDRDYARWEQSFVSNESESGIRKYHDSFKSGQA